MRTATIVFDIGGSLFRSGICTADGTLLGIRRRPAVSYRSNSKKTVPELREALVDYVLEETNRLRVESGIRPPKGAAISLGAAIDANTGLILGSGPLWGAGCKPFSLLEDLRRRMPDISWHLVNDITAALLRHAAAPQFRTPRRMALVTVSSGIGCRTYDFRTGSVPVDPEHGLQGEIGHITIPFEFANRRIELRCDCGAMDHLNAFCSGRGIAAVLRELARIGSEGFATSLLNVAGTKQEEALQAPGLAGAVSQQDPFALQVLDAVTRPLATVLVYLLTLDPEVECLVLTGGVAHGMGDDYLESVLRNMDAIGLYQITSRDPTFFRRRLRLGIADGNSGLIGAAIAATQAL